MVIEDSTDADALRLAEEQLVVEKVDRTSTVRVSTRTVREDVEVAEHLRSVRAEITRIPIDRYVDAVPEIENRDGVMIIPVVEEVLVKRLVLREEVHIRQVAENQLHSETISLRSQIPVADRIKSTD